jgi:hypothetical protein
MNEPPLPRDNYCAGCGAVLPGSGSAVVVCLYCEKQYKNDPKMTAEPVKISC